jgi:hypothetical protein
MTSEPNIRLVPIRAQEGVTDSSRLRSVEPILCYVRPSNCHTKKMSFRGKNR